MCLWRGGGCGKNLSKESALRSSTRGPISVQYAKNKPSLLMGRNRQNVEKKNRKPARFLSARRGLAGFLLSTTYSVFSRYPARAHPWRQCIAAHDGFPGLMHAFKSTKRLLRISARDRVLISARTEPRASSSGRIPCKGCHVLLFPSLASPTI